MRALRHRRQPIKMSFVSVGGEFRTDKRMIAVMAGARMISALCAGGIFFGDR